MYIFILLRHTSSILEEVREIMPKQLINWFNCLKDLGAGDPQSVQSVTYVYVRKISSSLYTSPTFFCCI